MDHITDVATHEPAVALLYFLIFLIPFIAAMTYMIRQNSRWKRVYTSLYQRIWALSASLEVETINATEADLSSLITTNAITVLEQDLIALESKSGVAKAAVISNTYMPKPKRLQILSKRLDKVESRIKETTSKSNQES